MRRSEWSEEDLLDSGNRMSKGPGTKKDRAGWDGLAEPRLDEVSGT